MTNRPLVQPPSPQPERDEVVLVDDAGQPLGTAPRLRVHSTETPLHLAFSTYLLNSRGEVLITRRALSKKTWPGVWTNSCCGHPMPGEAIEDAARRRIREELGLQVGPLTPLLPDFRYRAVDASGIVENEICPVFAGWVTDTDPVPDTDEVAEWAWVPWDALKVAVAATPQVYSPWAVSQIPQIELPGPLADTAPGLDLDPARMVADVDAVLTQVLADLAGEWREITAGMGVDVLRSDLPEWLGHQLVGRGKRLRVVMAYWGFVASGGSIDSPAYRDLVRIAAALETLHLFALIHDDIMDGSDSRRGRPAAHVEAATWHREADAWGDADAFGRNLAVLLGDLAHTMADRLVAGLPTPLSDEWYELSVELIAGQRADLTGAAAHRLDREHADRVARLKSGRYSVVRPLRLGAIAAGASPAEYTWLGLAGDHVGQAFALRDDYLGVWGDPARTGKPAGDDLIEAKATALLDVARHRLSGEPRQLIDQLGTAEISPEAIAELSDAMRAAGVADEIESLISSEVGAAEAIVRSRHLDPSAEQGLITAIHAVAWRES